MKPVKSQSTELNNKRAHYIDMLKKLDADNKKIIDSLERMEKTAGQLRAQLNKGRQAREKIRNALGRQKRIIKNMNRADNGSEII